MNNFGGYILKFLRTLVEISLTVLVLVHPLTFSMVVVVVVVRQLIVSINYLKSKKT